MMNNKTTISDAIVIDGSFDEIVKQFELNFSPDYCAQIYTGQLYVFKEDVYFESLDLDKITSKEGSYGLSLLFEKNLYIDNALIQEN